MNRVIRDGKVAVLVSGGFGAGWYSWNSSYPQLLFDPTIVGLVEKHEKEIIDKDTYYRLVEEHFKKEYSDEYMGGVDGLYIEWIPVGTKFRVIVYDGAESLEVEREDYWIVA